MIEVLLSQKPAVLQRKESAWLAELNRAVSPTAREKITNKYRHPEIKTALDTMFHGKCAYCESKIRHVSDPHIEHYRPKRTFPRLTFAWDNLLLACGICNSTTSLFNVRFGAWLAPDAVGLETTTVLPSAMAFTS